MATRRLPKVTFDGALMTRDAAGKGWGAQELADATSSIKPRTVYRFLSNQVQTVSTAKALAKALGFSVRRYILPVTDADRRATARRDGDRREARA